MNRLISLVLAACCCLLQASCMTGSRQGRAAGVQVTSSGIIRLEGRAVPVNEIGAALRKSGYGSGSRVNVEVPDNISPAIMKSITASLSRAGFRRVLFIKPRQAHSGTAGKR